MHGTSQSLSMTIVAFVLAMIGLLFGLAVFTENRQQLTANQAVAMALTNNEARNDSASDGLFVLDRDQFENDVRHSNVASWRQFNKKYNTNGKSTHINFHYLKQTNENGQNFEFLNKNNKNSKNYIPIKAVKVIVTVEEPMSKSDADKQVQKHPKQLSTITKHGQTYLVKPLDIVTYAVNTQLNRNANNMNPYLTRYDYAKGTPKDSYYYYNNDLTNKDQQNKYATK